jgi:adenine-specific DNA-methyltransferase
VRYIGNKTKLVPFILRTLARLGIAPGAAHDAFAGTASVGRALKEAGWRVASSDIMTYSYVLQRAYVVASRPPALESLLDGDAELRRALGTPHFRDRAASSGAVPGTTEWTLAGVGAWLAEGVGTERGFVSGHFAPAGGRMYFTEENAGRIDAARRRLHEWRAAGLLDDDTFHVLLAALIEGADRVANTAGVYAAYIKRWQSNARRPLSVEPVMPQPGAGSTAHIGDATELSRTLGAIDLLYVDPPYNNRQYASYYHVPELIARGWFEGTPALRGTAGLLAEGAPWSDWCFSRRVGARLRELLETTGARHALVSYNSEGHLSHRDLLAVLRAVAIDGRARRFTSRYRRYRADRDRDGRRYLGDEVVEQLYYVKLK